MSAVMESKERYKKWFNLSLTVNLVCSLTVVGLLIVIGIMATAKTPPRMVAVTPDYRVIQLKDLKKPVLTDSGLLQFATDLIPRTLSFDFDKWRMTLNDARNYFSPRAFRNYEYQITEQGWLNLVQHKRLIVSTVVTGTPVIVKRYLEDGRATYEIQAPIMVSVQSTQNILSRNQWTLKLKIQRCSLTERERGLWVSLFQIV